MYYLRAILAQFYSGFLRKCYRKFSFQTPGEGDESEKCSGSAAKHAALFCV